MKSLNDYLAKGWRIFEIIEVDRLGITVRMITIEHDPTYHPNLSPSRRLQFWVQEVGYDRLSENTATRIAQIEVEANDTPDRDKEQATYRFWERFTDMATMVAHDLDVGLVTGVPIGNVKAEPDPVTIELADAASCILDAFVENEIGPINGVELGDVSPLFNTMQAALTKLPPKPDVLEEIRKRIAWARADLGDDLGGFSVVDLIADNFEDLSLEEIREALDALGEPHSGCFLVETTEEGIYFESGLRGERGEDGLKGRLLEAYRAGEKARLVSKG